ncbi:S41 family peptidase [Sphingomonas sp. KR1UV-12]|uniref:S41 family peptidase n=1 Tax=Sphingomonas aurea TaxID=3063994 RepID=A0ABT9EM92_9SPHN|nr:S41 family peptidase [Sphingomonas sp. KR1UV-12]MDP1028056.1 S41 family peptidase [Sphingomonas sp. KR1UV-12]
MRRPLLTATAILAAMSAIPLATAAMAAADTDTYREFDQFLDVFNRIKANYVDQVDDKTLIKGAIDGMLASLDPHSVYETGVDYDNLRIMTEGAYGGLGLTVGMQDGAVKVIAPQEDTPADRAGIKAGDLILRINGELAYGLTLDQAVGKMRGPSGSKITLSLVRAGRDKPIDVTMVRERIVQKPVKWEVRGDVGYININTFSKNTGAETRAAVAAITQSLGHKPLGYVVDVRNNGGGLLDEAIAVADTFLDKGEIVSQRGRGTDIDRYYAESRVPGDVTGGLPVVVLTDAGTASASEIVAGALQDHHRALVMGERSFGKGSVQSVIELGPNRALKITTARYYTPSGHSVQEGGIEPDIRVPQLSDPDYKDRPIIREADLRRHLVNEGKADDKTLETDTKDDPRFTATAEELKKQGIDDFQLNYALKTIARLGGAAQVAAATKPRPVATPTAVK